MFWRSNEHRAFKRCEICSATIMVVKEHYPDDNNWLTHLNWHKEMETHHDQFFST